MKNMLVLFIIIFAISITACGGDSGSGDVGSGNAVARPDPPQEYAGLTNPFTGDQDAEERGRKIYDSNCASCHGEDGKGDGVVAESLDPVPTNFVEELGFTGDDYLYWRAADGGLFEPFNSAMPAWKTILSQDQIWEVIAYMRTFQN